LSFSYHILMYCNMVPYVVCMFLFFIRKLSTMTQVLLIYYGFLYLICSESLQIRYAYELLTNPLWKRDYDLFGIDEQLVSTFFCIL
jgi:hypothetical protein